MIETERLVLRPWEEPDRAAFVAMLTDPEVGAWLGGARTCEEASDDFDRMQAFWSERGYGQLAVVRKADGAVIGRVGCRRQPVEWKHPMVGHVEIGWLLARNTWGFGYATEAATALLRWGFDIFDDPEIFAWTAAINQRSQAVMQRLSMRRTPEHDFDQPELAEDHPLRHHIVYAMGRPSAQ